MGQRATSWSTRRVDARRYSRVMSEASTRQPVGNGPAARVLAEHRQAIRAVLERHGVTNIEVFGSIARGDDGEGSDLDLLVDLPPDIGLFEFAGIQQELEEVVGMHVDLVPRSGLRERVRVRIEADLIPL